MIKIKKFFLPILLLFIIIFGINSRANNASPDSPYNYLTNTSSTLLDSNLFTHQDDTSTYNQGTVDMTGFTKTLENQNLILYVNDQTFAIRIENKATGYIWSSDLTNTYGLDLTNSFIRREESAFTFTYLDTKNRTAKHYMLDADPSLSKTVDTSTNTVTFHVDLTKYQIRLAYSLTLEDNNIKFYLNKGSIDEYGTKRLLNVTFYEFLGAVYKDSVPGYNFIPSGNGALVRYTANSPINSLYKARFYGQDLYYPISANDLSLDYPIYGSVHGINQNGLFVNITNGAEFAEYDYSPPGYQSDFHIQSTTFYYRESYIQAVPGSDTSITTYEKNLKNYDIKFDMTFLTGDNANYVGMAKTYKNYLIQNGILNKSNDYTSDIGLHLDTLGGDYEEGIFFNKFYKMTTTNDILTINNQLKQNGVQNIYYTLRGFNKGGYGKADYQNYTFNSSLGSLSDLKNLNVSYYYDPVVKTLTKASAAKNTLVKITSKFAVKPILMGDYYQNYMDIDAVTKAFPAAYKKINSYGGMALDGLSNTFYTDKKYSRDEMYSIYDHLVKGQIPMYDPNDIMLKHTSKFLDTPLQHQRLKFFTDNVPFLEIVLSGYVPYYSSYLNFSANMKLDVLKVIDFGANPAYLITKQPSHLLTNTLSREFYGSYYSNLSDYIISDYNYINNALKYVNGQEIVQRDVVSAGVVVVTWSNQVKIMVNYSNQPYEDQFGHTVNAMDYLVIGS